VKRFYEKVSVETSEDDSYGLRLDGRPVRTPSRSLLVVPSPGLARAIADEWRAQVEDIDPRTMPLTGLANAAIDRIAPERRAFVQSLAAYGESDLLCYRAEGPAALAARQAEQWDPWLAWARTRFDVDFRLVEGVMHRRQPDETVARLRNAVAARRPFELAGLTPLVTVGGSLILALALAERAIGLEAAWSAATVDEQWQIEQWGEDAEAWRALEFRRAEFEAGYRFLTLLDDRG
jgi:chaperone required for assembly of F1-ATPase